MSKKRSVSDRNLKHVDDRTPAMVRYGVIAAYLASAPARGERGRYREMLAEKTWHDEDGNPFKVSAETIRRWIRLYRTRGLTGLHDQDRPKPGVEVLNQEQKDVLVALREEVPERSVERVIEIAEEMKLIDDGIAKRSTVYRLFREKGISRRHVVAEDKDLDRFEALMPNDLWQSDMLVGPRLPDPKNPGKTRTAYFYGYLDDHSRFLLDGRFSFKGDLPALELSFRRAIQRWGLPTKVYYDNGAVYRSHHMKAVCAETGIAGIAFTKPYRPAGHGKIERFNLKLRTQFIAEATKSSSITTLEELNEAFSAWVNIKYNERFNEDMGAVPRERFDAEKSHRTYIDDEALNRAFLWREGRTTDKSGIFPLFGKRYQVSPGHGKRKIVVRYDYDDLSSVEVYLNKKFLERVKPYSVKEHRGPSANLDDSATEADRKNMGTGKAKNKPTADYLAHLAKEHKMSTEAAKQLQSRAQELRAQEALMHQNGGKYLAIIQTAVSDAIFDKQPVLDFHLRFGPFDNDTVSELLVEFVDQEGRDHHITRYLDATRGARKGKSSC